MEYTYDKLKILLDDMIVPNERKSDIRWLAKNLAIRNSEHPNFSEAMKIIKTKYQNLK